MSIGKRSGSRVGGDCFVLVLFLLAYLLPGVPLGSLHCPRGAPQL